MNSYFFKMTNQERDNILDQHKKLYDGFATNYTQPNEQPLYVQDFANDKEGITVSNKGEVGVYRNMNINESDAFTGAKYLPEPTFESEEDESYMVSMGEQLDMIGDGDDDLEHGTFGHEEEKEPNIMGLERCSHCAGTGQDLMYDEECEWCGGTGIESGSPLGEETDEEYYDIDIDEVMDNENLDEELRESLQEQVNKSLDMFRRFKNY